MDRRVGAERAAAVGARAEEDRLPERGDDRHVRLEVEPGDVGEEEPDDRVLERAGVERAHEALAVGAGLDVVALGRHTAEGTAAGRPPRVRRWRAPYRSPFARASSHPR